MHLLKLLFPVHAKLVKRSDTLLLHIVITKQDEKCCSQKKNMKLQ